ncbi:MAG: hypothetical protein KatS3mg023_1178 [Armatimonadota bacterium]|nr:MAG: hypothetical protein KatS3mg023_1178 [Armatimonadota bacterium]
MLAPWRLIRDEAGEAAWNMAVDEAMLESVIAGEQPPTVRFYRWARPSVSLGRFQHPERVLDTLLCRERGLSVVRRLTGGKAVLHGHDLTLCVVAPVRCFAPAHRVLEVHLRLVRALARGFALLGIETRPVSRTDVHALRGAYAGCFEHVLPGDLTTPEGVKLVGGAQYRRSEVVMEQMSIPIAPLPDSLRNVLQPWKEPAETPLRGIPPEQLMEVLQEGISSELDVQWQVAPLSPDEVALARCLQTGYVVLDERGRI